MAGMGEDLSDARDGRECFKVFVAEDATPLLFRKLACLRQLFAKQPDSSSAKRLRRMLQVDLQIQLLSYARLQDIALRPWTTWSSSSCCRSCRG